ncbi:mgtA regulatory leader peptide MgtL [Raoultella sp. RIT712]|uniref:mgtA regulatory leader peptide MgtL n=1 Tax=Klebsiella/Raoultella group TaxID=2890311 RepID=UPI00351A7244
MLLNQTAMSKVWFTSGLVTRGYYWRQRVQLARWLRYSLRRFSSLTGDFMDPDPTPHPRWSNSLFR